MMAAASLVVLLLLLLLVPSFGGGYGADVVQNATSSEYVPLESSLYSKAFVGRWNQQNAVALDDYLQLSLVRNGNTSDGVTLSTPTFYFNGYFRASILLPKGDTAGTVATFYVASEGTNHTEIDFEFLGNRTDNATGQSDWHLQTNIFANGVGGREQRISLWFDPSADFHYYSIIWNHKTVSLYIDEVLIRIFQNYEDEGIAYLNSKAVQAYMSVFDGSSWATRGGRDKIDWTNSPFKTVYTHFILDACVVEPTNISASHCANSSANNWWNDPYFYSLPADRLAHMDAIFQNYSRYDYCTDFVRNPVPPKECTLPRR